MPEDHGIYNTHTYMLNLVKWVQRSGNTIFQRCDLPKHLKCRWWNRAITNGLLHPVKADAKTNVKSWKLAPKYQVLADNEEIQLRGEIDDAELIQLIQAGVTTRPELRKRLAWSPSTVYTHVNELVAKGVLIEAKIGSTCAYEVAT